MRIVRLALLCATLCAPAAFAQNTKNFPSIGRIHREDPRLDQLIAPDAKIEVLAGGFEWTEGPVWYPPAGGLLFSDIPNNAVILWKEGVGTSVYMKPSGTRASLNIARSRGATASPSIWKGVSCLPSMAIAEYPF
jgi:gluconolactonase